ncbi:hypothetical protein SERLA73DRAFT_87177 [Serpula lacrymans var. lacrymans S7.3]|uniref:Amidase domain-containing protein n=2 Tax=Serpula lacrymans var. lacrymans TaxID=341189 RepID=F8PSZ5_SERL3|nr:uncharacterized protein SERLADRAFT_436287 [Serpula lacrymans var. lacrymans S7.9]EGO00853.1 hypothetical protein SERLA73DRAFT_87177 [Serpula lacrymans var. lacrymans S7.3]EGO26476.1 hypothetical protein SERLADRAFT_436287 [Serpula lacrymans var. lacrymans S7.9]
MSSISSLPVVTGNAAFTAKVSDVRERLESQIPTTLRLPSSLLDNLPLDVTGIPESCGLLSENELAITDLDATAVCDKIAKGELTAVDTVTAFGKRAAIAHQLTACLTDYFLDVAIAQAQELDDYFKREGKVFGPLHGLPISVKDHIPIRGRWCSVSFLSTLAVSTEDCDMIRILRSLGAIFYVKTTQPQGGMTLECLSFYGRTLNPYNSNLTAGGSTGGEGALLAMKGSCMGLGTDAGGSIRAPCANCGLYGICPTAKTLPTRGYTWFQYGADGVSQSTGPMCRSARDMKTFLHAINSAGAALSDSSLIPIPCAVPDLSQRKLRVGIMTHDNVVLPHPPILRALEIAKQKLSVAPNIELIEYIPYDHDRGYNIIRETYFEDGGQIVRRHLDAGGENITPLLEWAISPPFTKDHDAAGIHALRNERDKYRFNYSDHWNIAGCDVVLCPPGPGTAGLHETMKYWGYLAIWNLLDYPGLVFPTGLKADPSIDVIRESFEPMSDSDQYNNSLYDPELFVGAPISLQLVARRFNDGLLLAAQEIIEKVIKS